MVSEDLNPEIIPQDKIKPEQQNDESEIDQEIKSEETEAPINDTEVNESLPEEFANTETEPQQIESEVQQEETEAQQIETENEEADNEAQQSDEVTPQVEEEAQQIQVEIPQVEPEETSIKSPEASQEATDAVEKEEHVKTETETDIETSERPDANAEPEEREETNKVLPNKDDEEDLSDFEQFVKAEEEDVDEDFTLEDEKNEEGEPETDREEIQEKKKKKLKKKKPKRMSNATNISVTTQDSGFPSLAILTASEKESMITGDFTPADGGSRPRFRTFSLSTQSEDEEEEEEEEVEEEEVQEEIVEYNRDECYIMYDKFEEEIEEEQSRNTNLQKLLVNYYKRKKIYHVLFEGKIQLDTQKKYEKQLDDFDRLMALRMQEQVATEMEIVNLKEKYAAQEIETQKCFAKLQHDEYEVGKEIINSEAGLGYEEKFIERYLKRQKIQLNNLIKMRLDYIKIRNKVNETQEALNALDNLGSHLRLVDYEQMKLDNRNLKDKLEEKDLELTRVRLKCQNAMQILAHRREKAAALNADVFYLKERLDGVNGEFEDVREQLNGLKQERDWHRAEIDKMKEKSGLLSRPTLLRDMGKTFDEIKSLSENLQKLKSDCFATTKMIKRLRINMSSDTKLKMVKEKMLKTSTESLHFLVPLKTT